MRNLNRITHWHRRRLRQCIEGAMICNIEGCENESAGAVETWSSYEPVCAEHIPGARKAGYTVIEKMPEVET